MADISDTKSDGAAEKAYAEAASNVTSKAETPAAKTAVSAQPEKSAAAKSGARKSAGSKPAANAKSPGKKAARKPASKRKAAVASAAMKSAAPKPKAVAAKPTNNELKDTIMANDKNNTTDFTKTPDEARAEMQARVKTAYEKSNEMTGALAETARGNVEAVTASGRILAEGLQSITRDTVEESKNAFETMAADMKKLAAVQSPSELFELQSEIARRNFDALIGYGSKSTEAMVKLANEAFAPISSRASVVVEKTSKLAA